MSGQPETRAWLCTGKCGCMWFDNPTCHDGPEPYHEHADEDMDQPCTGRLRQLIERGSERAAALREVIEMCHEYGCATCIPEPSMEAHHADCRVMAELATRLETMALEAEGENGK